MQRSKITVVGAGRVGSTAAARCVQRELGEVVLWNRTPGTAKGVALDISESAPLDDVDASITGTGEWEDTTDSDAVVVTAGAPRKPGMNRADLLDTNKKIVGSICEEVKEHSPDCVLIIITNPLDAMVHVAKDVTGFPRERVIGMAGVLDASRFRSFVASELDVSVEDVVGAVMGGHGDVMVPLTRHASVGGIPLTSLMDGEKVAEIVERTKGAGGEIVELEEEGSAFYAPGDSAAEMVEAIVKDKKRVLPCSVYLKGEYGIEDLFMGVPVVLGEGGMEKVLETPLNEQEEKALKKSEEYVREMVEEL